MRSETATGLQLGKLAVLTAEALTRSCIVLNDTVRQCQVVRVGRTSSETPQDAASPKYQKITPTTPTTTGNNATGQHILTV